MIDIINMTEVKNKNSGWDETQTFPWVYGTWVSQRELQEMTTTSETSRP